MTDTPAQKAAKALNKFLLHNDYKMMIKEWWPTVEEIAAIIEKHQAVTEVQRLKQTIEILISTFHSAGLEGQLFDGIQVARLIKHAFKEELNGTGDTSKYSKR